MISAGHGQGTAMAEAKARPRGLVVGDAEEEEQD
jgi:hypothetical protein